MEDPMVKCRVCGNKMPITGMALDANNSLLCRKCQSRGTVAQQTVAQETTKVELPKGTKNYQCQSCNYNFKRVPKSTQAMRCPYCASDNVRESEDTAQKLIDEMSDFEEQKFFKE